MPRLISDLLLVTALTGTAWACSPEAAEEGAVDGAAVLGGTFATLEREAAFPEAFSYLTGVREMPDGTLLAADAMARVFLRLDLDAGTADTLGGQGEGPQEYAQPDHVFPLPGDFSLLVDLGNGRLTLVDPLGTFVEWISMSRQGPDGRVNSLHPAFVDGGGFLYELGSRGRAGAPPDSAPVVRFDRATEAEHRLAWVWRDAGRRDRNAPQPAMIAVDDWAVGADGRIAVVRANGVSVDWYLPGGGVIRGPAYELEPFPVGPAEKEAELETMQSSAVFVISQVGGEGTETRQMGRGLPPGTQVRVEDFAWPETLPPFRMGWTLVSPSGDAWVQRMMPTDRPPRVEVFDGRGNHLGRVELPQGCRVIGFASRREGAEAVYLVRTDAVGLKWLERHRILR